ncbi:MFS transporter [Frankia sp. QA3]|uniref:MFS transporter n=1 Tax=Frankia sp. QA3 TaxID=710111 RepID=UPI0018DEE891
MGSGPLLATRRGQGLLALLCAVAFLDFVDASIVNVALPDIRRDLDFSAQGLQWVPSGYLLTYGGFMMLGGRVADLLGRRRVLLAGTVLIGLSSLVGGLAGDAGVLVAARLAQGLGAALMLPAALSILTTTFREGSDRHRALGVWGGVGGLASAVGVFLGGVLAEGPGWRWVFFVNPIAAALVIPAVIKLIPGDRRRARLADFDAVGGVLVTGGMLLLVFALVEAPDRGWGSGRTIGEIAGAGVLLTAFLINERMVRRPLLPLSIFRLRGLGAADVTGLTAFAGLIAMFFFLTLYLQNVLGYSPIRTGAAYLPLCAGVGIAAGICSQLLARVGTRPVIVVGALLAAGGLYYLSRIPVDGSYLTDLLPGLMIVSFGLGSVFVGVTTAANAGVPADQAGLAAALLNSSQQVGAALGLAIFSAIATARTDHLLAEHATPPAALTAGFQRALLTGCIFLLAAAVIGLRTANAHGEPPQARPEGGSTGSNQEVAGKEVAGQEVAGQEAAGQKAAGRKAAGQEASS